MHFDTRLFHVVLILAHHFLAPCSSQYSDDQSYLSLVEFHRGGPSTNLIFASPHGGFLGANLTLKKPGKPSTDAASSSPLLQLPIGGCYNNTLDRCVYTIRDCLRSDSSDGGRVTFHADARCITDRSSTASMNSLTQAIADACASQSRPFLVLNKLTRQYIDPAEDLLVGTFLLESATRVYIDYHRFIAMAKEAIRSRSRGLFIEFVFHRNSQVVQLGYGLDYNRSSIVKKPSQSTINDLILRSGSNVIRGNTSLGYFLHRQGFPKVVPLEQHHAALVRSSTHSTRSHADQGFNAILFSYPIERLRTHSIKHEATRIAKAIEQFVQINHMRTTSSASSLSLSSVLIFLSRVLLTSSS